MGFILDTNVFNAVADETIDLSVIAGRTIYAIHVQIDELSSTPDPERRHALLAAFQRIGADDVPTTSMVWGVSRWGRASWGGSEVLHKLHDAVRTADAQAKKKVSPQNQLRDALLGETAIQKGLYLVTADKGLREAVVSLGGKAVSLEEFSAS